MVEAPSPKSARTEPSDLFRLLVESVIDYAIFLLDPNGYVLTWNEGAKRIKGYEAHEIVGRHFSIFYPPQEGRRGKPQYGLRVAADEGRWAEEGWRIRKDGSRFWASVVITALRDTDGNLVGFAKVTRDLTERQQAEDERRQLLVLERAARTAAGNSLQQLQAIEWVTEAALAHLNLDDLLETLLNRIIEILDVDTVAILLLEEKDQVLVARAAKGLEEEVERGVRIPIGQGFAGRIVSERHPIILEDVQHSAILNPILGEKGVQSLMGVPLRAGERVVGVLHVGTLFPRHFRQDDEQLLQIVGDRVALAIDHAQLYEAAQRAQTEANRSAERLQAQEEFLSIAAHELKTPMTSLKTAVHLLLRRVARQGISLPPEIERPIAAIGDQTNRLARLTEQLLEAARLDAKRLPIDRQQIDVVALVKEVMPRFQEQTARYTLALSAPPQAWASLDPLRLEQVLSNLLENALKFSGEAERVEIEVAQPHPQRVQIAVRDYGPGVPPAQRHHLFERFYQARAEHARAGLGLGLYISRQIVEQHGGMLYAEFPSDGGSRFVVVLPTQVTESLVELTGTGAD